MVTLNVKQCLRCRNRAGVATVWAMVEATIRDVQILRGRCLLLGAKDLNPDGTKRSLLISQLRHRPEIELIGADQGDFYFVVSSLGCVGYLSAEDSAQIQEDVEGAIALDIVLDSIGEVEFLNTKGRLWVEYCAQVPMQERRVDL